MLDPKIEVAIQAVEQELEDALVKLRASKDPNIRRKLLNEMRSLIWRLDQLVMESIVL